MRHVWTVLCSSMVTDRDTNAVSLLNIIESLVIHDTPRDEGRVPVRMTVATLWMRDDPDEGEKGFQRLRLVAPTGEVLGQWEIDIDLSDFLRVRHKFEVRGFPASATGIYTFRVEKRESKQQRWKQVAEAPLQVIFAPQDVEAEAN